MCTISSDGGRRCPVLNFSGLVGKGVLPLKDRLAVCPPERYLSLFTHYVVPRYLAIFMIEILLFGIGKRNAEMTARQTALAIIYGEAGTHFDPDIIRILKSIEERQA